jgi:predicted O-methyltransferase YrrM
VPASRKAKDWAKRQLRRTFEIGQRFGVDILPRHFYSVLPNIAELKANRRWQRRHSLVGVRGTDIGAQLQWLAAVCTPALAERLPALALQKQAAIANGALGYGPVESDVLYCVIHTLKPRKMIQVGAGASTWVALKAAEDAGHALDITCVDPYPTDYLTALAENNTIDLRRTPVQDLGIDELTDLHAGDILFVDSTHTVSIGSDVNYLILDVLPRLRAGTLVHLHDVTMPYDYMPYALSTDLFFWTESVLLHAFLIDNPCFEIRLGCAMLHDAAREEMQKIIPTYTSPLPTVRGLAADGPAAREGQFPSSIWLEVIADPPG